MELRDGRGVRMSRATNHAGWQVEAYDARMGWRRASKVMATIEEAQAKMAAWPVAGVELRVYERLTEVAA